MNLEKKIDSLILELQKKKYNIVIENSKKLIKKYPDNWITYNVCGLAYQGKKDFENAKIYFLKAIEINPIESSPKMNLANTYNFNNEDDKSENLFKKIIDKFENEVLVFLNYANLKKKMNDYSDAVIILEKALRLDPNLLIIHESLAECYQALGEFTKTSEICEKIIRENPLNIKSYVLLSRQTDFSKKENDPLLTSILKIYKDTKINENLKIDLSFILSKAFDDKKDFEKAFFYMKIANDIKDNYINSKNDYLKKLSNNIKVFFEKNSFDKKNDKFNEKRIIFICGLPRSGTSLLEQIISSHTEVDGLGEVIYLEKILLDEFFIDNKILNNKIYDHVNNNKDYISKKYLEFIKNKKSNFFTDKALQNYLWVGFIKIFFPNAKIIHCTRNLKENFLSIYKNDFSSSYHMGWAFNADKIIEYFKLYCDMMDFWNEKYNDIYKIEYENLVLNPKQEIKKILNYCELSIDDKCFNHHKNNRPVKTVSVYQVRRPIYKTSKDLSLNYEKYLGKYFAKLT